MYGWTFQFESYIKLDRVVFVYNFSTQEDEAGGSPWVVWCQHRISRRILTRKKKGREEGNQFECYVWVSSVPETDLVSLWIVDIMTNFVHLLKCNILCYHDLYLVTWKYWRTMVYSIFKISVKKYTICVLSNLLSFFFLCKHRQAGFCFVLFLLLLLACFIDSTVSHYMNISHLTHFY